jgi:hypothetical protein
MDDLAEARSADGEVQTSLLFTETCFFAIQQQWHTRFIVSKISVQVLKAYGRVEAELH